MKKYDYESIKRLYAKKKKRKQLGYIGVAIKKKRRELGITQENVVGGVCSVSYLSKIENLKSDLNTMYVEDIMKRLSINTHEIKTVNSYVKYINIMLEVLFFGNEEKGKKIFDEIRDWNDAYFNNFLRIMYYILIKDIDNMVKEYEEIVKIKESLEPEDINLFIGISFIAFFLLGEADEALRLASLAFDKCDGILFDVINKYGYLFYNKIGNYDLARLCYERHMKKCQIRGNIKDLIEFSKKMSLFNHFNNNEMIEENYFTIEERVLINAVDLMINNDVRCIKILDNYKFNKCAKKAYLFKLAAYDKFNFDIRKIIDDNKYELNFEEDMYYKVFMMKTEHGNEEMKVYISKVVLPYYEKRMDKKMVVFYSDLLIKELENNSRYKDALAIYKKRNQIV